MVRTNGFTVSVVIEMLLFLTEHENVLLPFGLIGKEHTLRCAHTHTQEALTVQERDVFYFVGCNSFVSLSCKSTAPSSSSYSSSGGISVL